MAAVSPVDSKREGAESEVAKMAGLKLALTCGVMASAVVDCAAVGAGKNSAAVRA